ncbi:MAG: GHMP kinase, partial [Candidatus Methanomethylicota archaeon]
APAHLHAGNFDLTGDLGRLYGTVGFAIDYQLEISAERSDSVEADDIWAKHYAEKLVRKLGVRGVSIKVKKKIPAYVGLGFHTTLALSIGMAISRLYKLGLAVEDIALAVRRGLITALGIYAFKVGGFIVEGGFKTELREKVVPPLIFRAEIPDNWFFIVATPEKPALKIREVREREDEVLKSLRQMPKYLSDELSRIVLMKVIPSMVERDLEGFGEGLTLFNSKLGEFWSEYQGGVYCHPVVEEGIKIMLKKSRCACQSSWGPTFYSIVEGEDDAKELAKELEAFLKANGGGEVFYTKADNDGAEILEG